MAQKYLKATPSRSIGKTLFQLMFGRNMHLKNNVEIRELIEDEWTRIFNEEHDDFKADAKEKIVKMRTERPSIKNVKTHKVCRR